MKTVKRKEESSQEKSKRLEEELLLRRQKQKEKTHPTSSGQQASSNYPFENSEVKVERKELGSISGDFVNVNIKSEPISIRDQIERSGKETESLLHPQNIKYWVRRGHEVVSNNAVGVAVIIGAIVAWRILSNFFLQRSDDSEETPKGKKKNRSQLPIDDFNLDALSIGQFKGLADEVRNNISCGPEKNELNEFIKTVDTITKQDIWITEEEHIQIMYQQVSYVFDDAHSVRCEQEESLESSTERWLCHLLPVRQCLYMAMRLNSFQDKLLQLMEVIEEKRNNFELNQLGKETQSQSVETPRQTSEQTLIVSETPNNQVSTMVQEFRHHLQREQIKSKHNEILRSIDRRRQDCRDRAHRYKDEKEKLKRMISQRQFLMGGLNRMIFSTFYIVSIIAFWSFQSSCSWNGDWVNYLKCTLIGTLDTTCRYMGPQQSHLSENNDTGASSLWTLLSNPSGFAENFMHNPWNTLYSTALSTPFDILSLASSALRQTLAPFKQTLIPWEYVFCGSYFFVRCIPAYAVQVVFGMLYISYIGSFISWALIILCFCDVAIKLIHEPLWPLVILSIVQLVYYLISYFKNKVDVDRNLITFYVLYIITMLLSPLLWYYREHILQIKRGLLPNW